MAVRTAPVGAVVKDPYAILQVHPQAEPAVIKAVHRALAKIYYPMQDGQTSSSFKAIQEAYELLIDPDRRAAHDRSRQVGTGQRVGNFVVKDFIAEGGIGRTYRGEHIETGLPVCIKILSKVSPVRVQIFKDEARLMWDLRHFSMPALRDIVTCEDGKVALVMSFIPGRTLAQIVEKVGPLEPEHVAWIAERILNALKYLHFHGVVHGDIKPQNIIVQPGDHTVVIVDFGLSMIKPKETDEAKGWTDHFAPPEQMDGRPLLPQSDFYSLALTMLYALSGGRIDIVDQRRIPTNTPRGMVGFVSRMLVREVLSRPSWETLDLVDKMHELREKDFGRSRSGLRPIPGVD